MNKNISIFQSFHHALNGIKLILLHERNARIHLVFTILVILLSVYLKLSIREWLFILVAIFLVWMTELVNTALEYLFDFVEPQKNPYVKIGKDMAAAAVLVSALLSILIGLLVLGPPLLIKLGWITAR